MERLQRLQCCNKLWICLQIITCLLQLPPNYNFTNFDHPFDTFCKVMIRRFALHAFLFVVKKNAILAWSNQWFADDRLQNAVFILIFFVSNFQYRISYKFWNLIPFFSLPFLERKCLYIVWLSWPFCCQNLFLLERRTKRIFETAGFWPEGFWC